MRYHSGQILSGDVTVAAINDNEVIDFDKQRAPFIIEKSASFFSWVEFPSRVKIYSQTIKSFLKSFQVYEIIFVYFFNFLKSFRYGFEKFSIDYVNFSKKMTN